MIMKKVILRALIFCSIIGMNLVLYVYLNPLQYNQKSTKTIESTIYDNPNHETIDLISMGHHFTVNFVRSADKESQNPGFPALHINLRQEGYGGLVHIIKTDHVDHKTFLDAAPFDTFPDIYPFYTKDQDFFDAPFWTYNVLSKSISYWIGHAYAVIIDDEVKTIQCIGGIGWGYRIPWYWPYPRMIQPYALNLENWIEDKEIFNQQQSHYYAI